MATYALMGNDISNAAGDGPPNFPFGITQPASATKDLANSSYVITNSDAVAFVHSSTTLTSNQTVTLPSATSNLGRQIKFKKTDSSAFAIQIVIPGANTLDGLTTAYPIANQFGTVTVYASAPGKWSIVEVAKIAPTYTSYKALGSGSYTPPPYVSFLRVRMVGGGGGGGAGGNSGGTGGNAGQVGGTTTFGTHSCTGGNGGQWNTQPNTGGTATIGAGAYGLAIQGSMCTPGTQITGAGTYQNGGYGGTSPFGGAGAGSYANTVGNAGVANSGSGGGGGGTGNTGGGNNVSGGGGASGGFIDMIISPVAGSYSYTIPDGGAGGTVGTVGSYAGAKGGSGFIEIYEHFC